MLRKRNLEIFICLLAAILISCVGPKPSPDVLPSSVQISAKDVVGRSAPDSKIIALNTVDEYCRPSGPRLIRKEENYLQVSGSRGMASWGPVESYKFTLLTFDLTAIPKDSFLMSAKVALYLLRYKGKYDDHLGDMTIYDRAALDNPNPRNVINSDVDFRGGWYLLDLTKYITSSLANGEKYLCLFLRFDRNAVSMNAFLPVRFASKRMGSHVAPQLIVEFAK